MTQHLTVEEVKAAARTYYLAGKLTAQHPDQSERLCHYQIGDYRCGIGAAMTDETLEAIRASGNSSCGISRLAHDHSDIVTLESKEIQDIQEEHDNWCRAAAANEHFGLKERHQAIFRQKIGIEVAA
jgi:hypothetical protein